MKFLTKKYVSIAAIGAVFLLAFLYGVVREHPQGEPVLTFEAGEATTTAATSTNQNPSVIPSKKPVSVPSNGATAPEGRVSLGRTYTDLSNKFSLSYPVGLNPQPFSLFHTLTNDWRVGASITKQGRSIISIPVMRIDNQAANKKVYPLFFGAEVRVGVSENTVDCYTKDAGYTSQNPTSVTIGGVAFKKFAFADAAMMKYIEGVSYRTIYDKKCYVIEQIKTGSSYMDKDMTVGYSDKELAAFYAKTLPIVMSFRFLK